MTSSVPATTVRIPKPLKKKLIYIAEQHFRKLNPEIIWVLTGYVRAYEAKHGEIKLPD